MGTLLTHFSQRYAKMPVFDEIRGKSNVGVAFGNMVVSPDNLAEIHNCYPAIERFCWKHLVEMDERKETYLLKYGGNPAGGVSDKKGGEGGGLLVDDEDMPFSKKDMLKTLERRENAKQIEFAESNKRHLWVKRRENEKKRQKMEELMNDVS